MAEKFMDEEGFLLEGSHLPVLSDNIHRLHPSLKPDVKVLLLSPFPIAKAEPPKGKYTSNLLIIHLYLMNQVSEISFFPLFYYLVKCI